MAKPKVFLEYIFVFSPGVDTWQRESDFNTDLSDFFAANKIDASVVETLGGSGRKMILLSPIEGNLEKLTNAQVAATVKVGRPRSVGSTLKQLAPVKTTAAERHFNEGTFMPRKGYLKR